MCMEITNYKLSHIQVIKERLNILYDRFTPKNINALKDALNKDSEYNIQYTTLLNTLIFTKRSIDLYCVIAMCKYFDVNISDVLAEPDSENFEQLLVINKYNTENQSVLNDPNYTGTFHGYFYSTKTTNSNIDEFTLTISSEGKRAKATLEIYWNTLSEVGTETTKRKSLTGTPILVDPSNIYIVFRNARNDHIILSYSYVKYRLNKLYFRRGAIVTMRTESLRVPLVESFVLFNKKLADEELQYIPGFLLLNDSDFHINKDDFDKLIESNTDVKYLHDNLSNIYNYSTKPVITINENQILNSKKVDVSKEKIVRGLLILKKYALDAKQISYPEIPEFSEFSKLLKKQEED